LCRPSRLNRLKHPFPGPRRERERGYYIHPELYGAPEEEQIEWARHPEMMKRMKERRAQQQKAAQVAQATRP
jgi:hypothetical protein